MHVVCNTQIFLFFFFILKGSSRKRPRLEKGQESMDTDMKKEDDLKSDPKGNEIIYEYLSCFSYFDILKVYQLCVIFSFI